MHQPVAPGTMEANQSSGPAKSGQSTDNLAPQCLTSVAIKCQIGGLFYPFRFVTLARLPIGSPSSPILHLVPCQKARHFASTTIHTGRSRLITIARPRLARCKHRRQAKMGHLSVSLAAPLWGPANFVK